MWELITNVLVSVADEYANSTASTYIWGEEEMPECMMEENAEE